MTYSEPTAATFKVRFPAFAGVADTTINAVLGEAIAQVGDNWIEDDRQPAQLYLTAHLLVLEGEPASTVAEALETVTLGSVKRLKVGDVETEFAGSSTSGSGTVGSTSSYATTEYGRRYLKYLRRSFPPYLTVV